MTPTEPVGQRVAPMTAPVRSDCPACFMERHQGHDVGLRHTGGSLYSATCHDCGETFARATEPMREFIDQTSSAVADGLVRDDQ